MIHQKSKKSLHEITSDLCPVLSIQQLYRISTMYWDDKCADRPPRSSAAGQAATRGRCARRRYGTETVSQEVLVQMKQTMTEETAAAANNSFLLDDDRRAARPALPRSLAARAAFSPRRAEAAWARRAAATSHSRWRILPRRWRIWRSRTCRFRPRYPRCRPSRSFGKAASPQRWQRGGTGGGRTQQRGGSRMRSTESRRFADLTHAVPECFLVEATLSADGRTKEILHLVAHARGSWEPRARRACTAHATSPVRPSCQPAFNCFISTLGPFCSFVPRFRLRSPHPWRIRAAERIACRFAGTARTRSGSNYFFLLGPPPSLPGRDVQDRARPEGPRVGGAAARDNPGRDV